MLLTSERVFYFIYHRYFTVLAFLGTTLEYFQSSWSIKSRRCFYVLKMHAEKPMECHIRSLILEETARSTNVTHVAPLPPTPFEKYLGAVCSHISIVLLDVCTRVLETCLNYYTVGGHRLSVLSPVDAAPCCLGSRAASAAVPRAPPRLIRRGAAFEFSPVQTKQSDRAL